MAALGSQTVGSIVKLNENGSPIEFYVAKHDYESVLNGARRTLVVRKDCYDTRAWHSSNVNAYASSSIDTWLNSTYKAMLDADIQSVIGTTKFYYTPGNGSTSVTTLTRAIFLLSFTELGKSDSYANTEGSALPIASTLQIAYRNGSAAFQWTRSPFTNNTKGAFYLNTSGVVNYYSYQCSDYNYGSRPAFTLPPTLSVSDDGTVTIDPLAPKDGHNTLIGGVACGIEGGTVLIGGTAYEIEKGMVLVNGTAQEISFGSRYLVTITVEDNDKRPSNFIVTATIDGTVYDQAAVVEVKEGTVIHCYAYAGITMAGGHTARNYVYLNEEMVVKTDGTVAAEYDYTVNGNVSVVLSKSSVNAAKVDITEE